MSEQQRIKLHLTDFVKEKSPRLFDLVGYHFGWQEANAHLQPTTKTGTYEMGEFVLKVGELLGNKNYNLAIAVELLCAFFDIHRDIQEGSTEHGDGMSLWMHCGPAQALNIGDGMFALARMALLGLEDGIDTTSLKKVLNIFDQTALKKCEGVYGEIEAKDTVWIELDEYKKTLLNSNGPIWGLALSCSFALSKTNYDLRNIFSFGEYTGLSLRIKEENNALRALQNKKVGKEEKVLGEFLAKRKPLALIVAMQKDNKTKRLLSEIYQKRVLTKDELGEVVKILNSVGAIEESTELFNSFFIEAKKGLVASGIEPNIQSQLETLLVKKLDIKVA